MFCPHFTYIIIVLRSTSTFLLSLLSLSLSRLRVTKERGNKDHRRLTAFLRSFLFVLVASLRFVLVRESAVASPSSPSPSSPSPSPRVARRGDGGTRGKEGEKKRKDDEGEL